MILPFGLQVTFRVEMLLLVVTGGWHRWRMTWDNWSGSAVLLAAGNVLLWTGQMTTNAADCGFGNGTLLPLPSFHVFC